MKCQYGCSTDRCGCTWTLLLLTMDAQQRDMLMHSDTVESFYCSLWMSQQTDLLHMDIVHITGGSHLSCTVVKPDSRLARIFVAKFLCTITLIIIIG